MPDDGVPAYGGHCPHVAAQIAQRSRLVHELAPGAFTYEVVTEPGNFAAFARATDVMGAEPLPVPGGPALRLVGDTQVHRRPRRRSRGQVLGLLQAFGYEKWRVPTPAELARTISQWQHSRWEGTQIFAWRYYSWSLASHPALLAVLSSMNSTP